MTLTKQFIFSLLAVVTALFLLLSFAPDISAQAFCDTAEGKATTFCKDQIGTGEDPVTGSDGIINFLINIFSFVTFVVAVFMVILGGYRIAFSNGDASSVESGRKYVIYAVVGILVAVFARLVVAALLDRI